MQRSLTGNQIKVIAAACMLIDHVGAFLIGPAIENGTLGGNWLICYILTRLFGRLAFPLYGFLNAEGIYHTGSRDSYAKKAASFCNYL